jgi:hypothetical protein
MLRHARELAERGYSRQKIDTVLIYGGFPEAADKIWQPIISMTVKDAAARVQARDNEGPSQSGDGTRGPQNTIRCFMFSVVGDRPSTLAVLALSLASRCAEWVPGADGTCRRARPRPFGAAREAAPSRSAPRPS